ncbi:MAG: 16S rRNA processing protein RimM [Bacilli bacterium]|nr:16S rRNA processing protein RimM [Bacilli bacterium]
MKEYLYFGKIVSTHGIKGEIRIKSNFERKEEVLIPNFNIYIGKDYYPYQIISYRHHKDFEMVTLEGINDINEALKLKSLPVYIKRADLNINKDDYVVEELILCTIMENNEKLGVIKEIIYNNGNDLLLVEGIKKFYIPLKGNYIEKVDLENNIVYTKKAKDLIL